MVSLTVENYLKAILVLCVAQRREPVSTGSIASHLKVAPGTVTAMLKTLEQAGLVRYRRYGGVQFTPEGEALALHVQRRHRVLELFLVKVLGMPWTEVHEEAEALEHAVSEKVLGLMDALLGYPKVDPHGDPIPQADGHLPAGPQESLSSAVAGDRMEVVRLLDQRPEFLKLAERMGLQPGARVDILHRDEPAQILRLRTGEAEAAVGIAAAAQILVERIGGSGGPGAAGTGGAREKDRGGRGRAGGPRKKGATRQNSPRKR